MGKQGPSPVSRRPAAGRKPSPFPHRASPTRDVYFMRINKHSFHFRKVFAVMYCQRTQQ